MPERHVHGLSRRDFSSFPRSRYFDFIPRFSSSSRYCFATLSVSGHSERNYYHRRCHTGIFPKGSKRGQFCPTTIFLRSRTILSLWIIVFVVILGCSHPPAIHRTRVLITLVSWHFYLIKFTMRF